MLRTRDSLYGWLMACDANMKPETFVRGKWLSERTVIIRVQRAQTEWKWNEYTAVWWPGKACGRESAKWK